jgi:hypothetical protein
MGQNSKMNYKDFAEFLFTNYVLNIHAVYLIINKKFFILLYNLHV